MTRQELLVKVQVLKDKWSAELGELTDIWLHPDLMDILDPRAPLDKLRDPYKIGGTFVTPFSVLDRQQVRIAFLTEINIEEASSEPSGVNGSTSGGE